MKNAPMWTAITIISVTIATLLFAAYIVKLTGSTESLVEIGTMVDEVVSALVP
jgi:hypothetical protein